MKSKVKKKVRRTPGDIIRIDFEEGWHTYGRVFSSTIGIYDSISKDELDINEIIARPFLFRIWVMDYAIKDGIWPIVGHRDLGSPPPEEPSFYKQDPISGRLYITKEGGGDDIPATLEECLKLECAAVWDPEHVVDRIADHYHGRPNVWLKSLSIDQDKLR